MSPREGCTLYLFAGGLLGRVSFESIDDLRELFGGAGWGMLASGLNSRCLAVWLNSSSERCSSESKVGLTGRCWRGGPLEGARRAASFVCAQSVSQSGKRLCNVHPVRGSEGEEGGERGCYREGWVGGAPSAMATGTRLQGRRAGTKAVAECWVGVDRAEESWRGQRRGLGLARGERRTAAC